MVGAFDMRKPHHLALLHVQVLKYSNHVEPQRHIRIGSVRLEGLCINGFRGAVSASPVIGHQIACDPEQERPELPWIIGRRRQA
jgi:hypothetical protein